MTIEGETPGLENGGETPDTVTSKRISRGVLADIVDNSGIPRKEIDQAKDRHRYRPQGRVVSNARKDVNQGSRRGD